jgi:hypothetical protein
MIYELCLKISDVVGRVTWTGRLSRTAGLSPGLLRILRPDKMLYDEAPEVNYRINKFELNKNNFMTFRSHTSPWLFDNVRDLVLDTRHASLLSLRVYVADVSAG